MPIDEEQLAELIEQQTVPLRLWAGKRAADRDDVVQEAFCRLVVEDPVPNHPVGWLYRVVRNLAESERISRTRRKKRELAVAVREAFRADQSQGLQHQEAIEAVWNLPDEMREVITARIWGGLTFEEIGTICELSTATAARRYHEALTQLRHQLEKPCPTNNP
jgi:RNA polymerase sigma-70 factor (ECF subfamily)